MYKSIIFIFLLITLNLHSQSLTRVEKWDNQNIQSSTGLLRSFMTNDNMQQFCTGTMIAPRYGITAAHCFFNDSLNQFQEMEFFPKRNSATLGEEPRVFIEKVWFKQDYINGWINQDIIKRIQNDIAIFEIPYTYHQQLNFHSLRKHRLKNNNSSPYIFYMGYPSIKPIGTLWTSNCKSTIGDKIISFNCPTYKGMSGGAIINEQSKKIIGINSGKLKINNQSSNVATFLNNQEIKEIKKIIKGIKPNPAYFSKHIINTKKKNYFTIRNNCDRQIEASIIYKDTSRNQWMKVDKIKLDINDENTIGYTDNDHYFYYAESYDKSKKWSGNDMKERYKGNIVGYKKKNNLQRFDDVLELNCR